MEAIKRIEKIKNGQIVIDLPPDFEAKEVEVTILPLKPVPSKKELLELLLNAPTLTEKELEEFEKVRL